METKISRNQIKKMKASPYYAVLHAINFMGCRRLPEQVEDTLGSDPEACLLYSMMVMKGRLPDSIHNRIVLGTWEGEEKERVSEYIESLKKKPETADS